MEKIIIKESKKVNNLDELDKLTIGEFVKIIDYADDEGLIFEGKLGQEYGFMQINYPVIWSHRINEDDIKFKDGMIMTEGKKIRLEMYSEKDNCYQEKLNLVKRLN